MKASRVALGGVRPLDLLRESKESFIRIEALEHFSADKETPMLKAYNSGELETPTFEATSEWRKLLVQYAAEGRPVQRLRMLSREMSPYLRFEMEWGYTPLTKLGEDFHIAIKEQNKDLSAAWADEYFVIDNKRVVYALYDQDNRWCGLEEETDPGKVKQKIEQKDRLLERSVPYKVFVSHLRKNAKVIVPDVKKENIPLES